jgi:hypothetical protein
MIDGYHWHYAPGVSAGVIPTNGGDAGVRVCAPRSVHARAAARSRRPASTPSSRPRPLTLAAALRIACRAAPFRGFAGHEGYFRRAWGPGWALVGDAGYFKDPLTAHGITDALRDAELLARAVIDGGTRRSPSTRRRATSCPCDCSRSPTRSRRSTGTCRDCSACTGLQRRDGARDAAPARASTATAARGLAGATTLRAQVRGDGHGTAADSRADRDADDDADGGARPRLQRDDRRPQPAPHDAAFTAGTRFKHLIVQGGLTTGLLHALVAMDLPGPGSVFLEQHWKFPAPVFIGDTITAEVEVLEVHPRSPCAGWASGSPVNPARPCWTAKPGAIPPGPKSDGAALGARPLNFVRSWMGPACRGTPPP